MITNYFLGSILSKIKIRLNKIYFGLGLETSWIPERKDNPIMKLERLKYCWTNQICWILMITNYFLGSIVSKIKIRLNTIYFGRGLETSWIPERKDNPIMKLERLKNCWTNLNCWIMMITNYFLGSIVSKIKIRQKKIYFGPGLETSWITERIDNPIMKLERLKYCWTNHIFWILMITNYFLGSILFKFKVRQKKIYFGRS